MVNLRPHPHSSKGETTILLDLELMTGTVPLDGFAVELLFHTEAVEIADIYLTDDFAGSAIDITKEFDNEAGHMLLSCASPTPYQAGPHGLVVATICVRTKQPAATKFSVGERTQLFIHA
jgi:hypothetical protein